MSAPLEQGHIFASDYKVVKPLGAGGMGSIYIVEQLSTGNLRALKLMHAQLLSDPKLRDRFLLEARVGSKIASDHVVQVLAAGVDPSLNVPWLVMELLQGEELAERVKRQGPLSPREVADIATQLCHALSAAHAVGVVHRDLQPNNLFLCRPRVAGSSVLLKVLDFGIAKIMAEAQTTGTSGLGTPLWMAPEQTESVSHVGPGTDLWAFGLIVFWALTGQVYWASGEGSNTSVHALLREMLMDPIAPPSLRAQSRGQAHLLPFGFDPWFLRCVERDRERRFASADQALAALLPILQGRGAEPAHLHASASPAQYAQSASPAQYAQSASPAQYAPSTSASQQALPASQPVTTFSAAPLPSAPQPAWNRGGPPSQEGASVQMTARTPPGFAMAAHPPMSPTVAGPTPRRSNGGLIAALAIGAVVLLGGGALGVYFLNDGSSTKHHHARNDDDDDDTPRIDVKHGTKKDGEVRVDDDAEIKKEDCDSLTAALVKAQGEVRDLNTGPNPGPTEIRALGGAFDDIATTMRSLKLRDTQLMQYAADYAAMANDGGKAARSMADATEQNRADAFNRAKDNLTSVVSREAPLMSSIKTYCGSSN